MRISATEEMKIAFNVLVESGKKLGHTEKSIKALIEEEFHKNHTECVLSETQLNGLYKAYESLKELYAVGAELNQEPEQDIKKLIIEFLNDVEQIFNHFEIIRPLKIETLLNIRLEDNKIKESIQSLLENNKVVSNSNTYYKDGREQTKEWLNKSLNKYLSIEHLGIEIFFTAVNKALYDEIIKHYGRNYKRAINSIVRKQSENEKDFYKDELEDIERCILNKTFKSEIFILFDSLLESFNIKNMKTSRNRKRTTIPLFNSIKKSIITKFKKME